ncbi:MAG: bacillithiol biosynthesis BshC, partial [Waddliaceae bacterium]
LRPLAKSFFKREISESDEILQILQSTTQKFEKAGGKASLDVIEGSNLFIKMEGKYRCKIVRDDEGFHVGRRKYLTEELLDLIGKEPERFSTNAAARTVLQSALFPTLAYVAGPGELSYYHQLRDYHRFHGVPMPWIVPRLSVTFVTPKGQEMLKKCRLEPWGEMPHHWPQVIPNLESGLEEMQQAWEASCLKYFSEDLPADVLSRFIRNATRKLQRKITVARLHREGIEPYSLHYLRNLLHPHEKLQERVISWWEFQSHTHENLVQVLLKEGDWQTQGHLYCLI